MINKARGRLLSMSPDYSIVIPVFYNEGSLTPTVLALQSEVFDQNPDLRPEVIFVDDGSGDGSLAELLSLQQQYPNFVKVIKFTRNFGQISAVLAGLAFSRGKCAIFISADGQDPPSLINTMLQAHFEENYDIVACFREGRDESAYRIWTSQIFYQVMRKLSFPNMPQGGFDFALLSRRVVQVLLRNREVTPFFQGQILWTGFNMKFIGYHRLERKIGRSRWTFAKKLTYLMDGVVAYSFFPIRFITAVGVLVAIIGFLYALVILVTKIFWGLPVTGWAPLMIVILVIGGTQMLMLGIIGEYLWRSLAQARNRDPYIIDAIYGEFHGVEVPATMPDVESNE
jgi:dolichol-phosphate mannosyltransferase